MVRTYIYYLLSITSSLCPQIALADWPVLPHPPHANVESIGERVVLNGVPMQMHRVLSKDNPSQLQQFYQRYLGQNHTVTGLEGGVVLAQGRDQHFITVRISQLDNGLSEALTTVSDVAAARANQSKPLGIPLPAQSKILSDMESSDQGKTARHLVYQNQYSMQANIAHLLDTLKQRGYQLQSQKNDQESLHHTLLLAGKNREARLVVMQQVEGSSVVLTMVQSYP